MKLGRIAGIDVYIHWTLIIAIGYVVFEIKVRRGLNWASTGMFLCLMGALFLSVLLHEYGHALVARQFGVLTRDIIMTPIGGLARLERMPTRPKEELLITIAGPLVNLTIAFLIALAVYFSGGDFLASPADIDWATIPSILMMLNLVLFGFNLMPAFPLDGGRILRSGLTYFLGYERATKLAVVVGQFLAIAIFISGLLWREYAFCVIGVFVLFAARNELRSMIGR